MKTPREWAKEVAGLEKHIEAINQEWAATNAENAKLRAEANRLHDALLDAKDENAKLRVRVEEPVPMLLHCPMCRAKHLDVGPFATKVHHTHACQECGHVWRPSVVATVGVEFLPGFKNEPAAPAADSRPPCAECGDTWGAGVHDYAHPYKDPRQPADLPVAGETGQQATFNYTRGDSLRTPCASCVGHQSETPQGLADALGNIVMRLDEQEEAQREVKPAPDNGMLAPLLKRLENLEASVTRLVLLEVCHVAKAEKLTARVTALEEWSRKSYLRDHRLAEPVDWKGCHLCNGLTIGTCHGCDKRICGNHVRHCDTCKAVPPAPVAEPVFTADEYDRMRRMQSNTYGPVHAFRAGFDGERCNHFDGFITCGLTEQEPIHTKPETTGPGHAFESMVGGPMKRQLCEVCCGLESDPIHAHAKDVGR